MSQPKIMITQYSLDRIRYLRDHGGSINSIAHTKGWPRSLIKRICDHDFYKTISGEIRLKMHDDHYWKIEDVNVVQEWCALEDAK